MRPAALFLVVWGTASAQIILPPEEASKFFARSDLHLLKCQIQPIHPALDFSFRYRAGYSVRVPLDQYRGSGHRWTIVVQVQPEPDGQPVAFVDQFDLPPVPNTDLDGEVGGAYMLGEGHYQAKFQLMDDLGRGCRAQWSIVPQPGIWDRGVKVAVPPGTIQEVALRSARSSVAQPPPLGRLTVLLHAAASSTSKVQASDVVTLLGALSSLLDLAPARSVKLVVFNLDQRKELYREDNFTLDRIQEVRQAIFNLQLGTVDVQTLQNATGHFDLLAKMVSEELNSPERSGAVVFLGPDALSRDKMPDRFGKLPPTAPKFFYVEYQRLLPGALQMMHNTQAAGPLADASRHGGIVGADGTLMPPPVPGALPMARDTIDYLVEMLKGKTLIVRTPGDFAAAMHQIAATKQRK